MSASPFPRVFSASASRARFGRAIALAGLASTLFVAFPAQAQVKSWFEFKHPNPTIRDEPGLVPQDNGPSAPIFSPNAPVVVGFEGISQFQAAALGRNFIPPDTMGAVGTKQFVEILNGAFAVFDKATGATLKFTTDTTF